ncbi:MAG: hypothetical protein ACJA0Q_000707 [Saprospiraceae bacterium]|jgi:hypothetical protein
MKILTLITLFTLTSFFAHAENCNRTGSFIGAGDVDVKGAVTLEIQTDGSIKLILSSDFVSDSGPDLDIYIGNTMRVDAFSVRLDALGSLAGSQTYTLPWAIKLTDYSYVTIHCTQYNHYYGSALLGNNVGDCIALKINDVSAPEGVNIKVNSSGISIDSDKNYKNVTLSVYNFTGVLIKSVFFAQVNKGSTALKGSFPTSGIVVLNSDGWALRSMYILN